MVSTMKYRPDLRNTFVHSYEYKQHLIEVYMIITEHYIVPKGKKNAVRYYSVHSVSYTEVLDSSHYDKENNPETSGESTYYNEGVVGFDSNHGWYKTEDDSEQYKHISSVMSQAEGFIDRLLEMKK